MYVLVVLLSGFQRPGFESTLRLWKWLFFIVFNWTHLLAVTLVKIYLPTYIIRQFGILRKLQKIIGKVIQSKNESYFLSGDKVFLMLPHSFALIFLMWMFVFKLQMRADLLDWPNRAFQMLSVLGRNSCAQRRRRKEALWTKSELEPFCWPLCSSTSSQLAKKLLNHSHNDG
jgi:hypothetical protein